MNRFTSPYRAVRRRFGAGAIANAQGLVSDRPTGYFDNLPENAARFNLVKDKTSPPTEIYQEHFFMLALGRLSFGLGWDDINRKQDVTPLPPRYQLIFPTVQIETNREDPANVAFRGSKIIQDTVIWEGAQYPSEDVVRAYTEDIVPWEAALQGTTAEKMPLPRLQKNRYIKLGKMVKELNAVETPLNYGG
jgi:hypothetical protein